MAADNIGGGGRLRRRLMSASGYLRQINAKGPSLSGLQATLFHVEQMGFGSTWNIVESPPWEKS